MAWVLLTAAIVLEVTATLSLRASDGFAKWGWILPVVIGYASSFVLLAMVLKRGIPVGVAYGIWAGMGVMLTAIMGRFLFGDSFTWLTGAGVVLVVAGVVVLEFGSGAHPPAS